MSATDEAINRLFAREAGPLTHADIALLRQEINECRGLRARINADRQQVADFGEGDALFISKDGLRMKEYIRWGRNGFPPREWVRPCTASPTCARLSFSEFDAAKPMEVRRYSFAGWASEPGNSVAIYREQ